MSEKTKLPFRVSEKCIKAFGQSRQKRNAVKLAMEMLLEFAADAAEDPWEVVKEEHPEFVKWFTDNGIPVNYISTSKMIVRKD